METAKKVESDEVLDCADSMCVSKNNGIDRTIRK